MNVLSMQINSLGSQTSLRRGADYRETCIISWCSPRGPDQTIYQVRSGLVETRRRLVPHKGWVLPLRISCRGAWPNGFCFFKNLEDMNHFLELGVLRSDRVSVVTDMVHDETPYDFIRGYCLFLWSWRLPLGNPGSATAHRHKPVCYEFLRFNSDFWEKITTTDYLCAFQYSWFFFLPSEAS